MRANARENISINCDWVGGRELWFLLLSRSGRLLSAVVCDDNEIGARTERMNYYLLQYNNNNYSNGGVVDSETTYVYKVIDFVYLLYIICTQASQVHRL